jgi:adenylate cyclase
MGLEIERKFLVEKRDWSSLAEGKICRQGYLSVLDSTVVRIRIIGDEAFLTVKGPDPGSGRREFEYEIPVKDATEMLVELCEKPVIEKARHRIPYAGHTWEVDVFHGDNEGLVLAEVEVDRTDEVVELPPWVSREVTGDHRYNNTWLVKHPFRTWERTSFP